VSRIAKEVSSNENQRRCPWCWEWIERAATKCNHCEKDVHPLRESGPVTTEDAADIPQSEAAPARTMAPDASDLPPAPAKLDLESSSGVAMWWATAILVYGILLAGVAVAFPFPTAGVGVVLLVVEIAAAYLINRAIWKTAEHWPASKVIKLVLYLATAVVVLGILVWVRRRFIG